MLEIPVPRESVNDEHVVVSRVYFASGQPVKHGDVVVDIETSKTTIEVTAPAGGFVEHSLEQGMAIAVGATLFRLMDRAGIEAKTLPTGESATSAPAIGAKISKSAVARARALNVDLAVFTTGLVSVADVERYAETMLKSATESSGIDQPTEVSITPLRHALRNHLVVLGGGGHAKMCIDILRQRNEYKIVGIVDSEKPIGTLVCGVPVIGDNSMLEQLWNEGVSCAVNGVGSVAKPAIRKALFEKLKTIGFYLPNLIHPSAVVEPSVTMGQGNQIMMGACVGSSAVLGDNCIVNSGAIVSHDCKLSSHCHIAPGAILAGSVSVGEIAVIGMGVTAYIGITIGARAMVNNGIHLFRDVMPQEIVKA